MSGCELIVAERERQVRAEGWTPTHDDSHRRGELARAAAKYALEHTFVSGRAVRWPWARSWWKPKDPIRNLVRAGALIAAEIDRLQRAEAKVNPVPADERVACYYAFGDRGDVPPEEKAANARLNAAAPELLTELRKLRNEVCGLLAIAEPAIRADAGNSNVASLLHRLEVVEAVLAKAEARR